MTNEELGAAIGVSPSMASRIRSGDRLPGTQTLYRISQAFDIPLQILVEAHAKGGKSFSRIFRARLNAMG